MSKLLLHKHQIISLPVDETDLWFIDFDTMTLANRHIDNAKMQQIISTFLNERPVKKDKQSSTNAFVSVTALALTEIYQTLLNFFSVQSQLQDNGQQATDFFNNLVKLLGSQIRYTSFFQTRSPHFRFYRLLASQIRLVKYLQFLYGKIQQSKANFDNTFFDNMNEVYLYIQQKIEETLTVLDGLREKETEQKNRDQRVRKEVEVMRRITGEPRTLDMNLHVEVDEQDTKKVKDQLEIQRLIRVFLQTLNLLVNFNGGFISNVAMNQLTEKDYIEDILKSNVTYYQFRQRISQEKYQVEISEQIDPRIKKERQQDQQDL